MNTLFGLLGQSLVHSISPTIHKMIFDQMNISACYHLFEVEERKLGDAVKGLMAIGSAGVNVTIPYKTRVIDYIDKLSTEAKAIGSVNCISFDKHGTVGYNTDYFGFGMMLGKYNIELSGRNATVLGNGGVAKTVIRYLVDHGIGNIVVVTRSIPSNDLLVKLENLKKVKIIDYSQLSMVAEGDLIINCTPCGMYPHIDETPVADHTLGNFDIAIDIIYNPPETMFLKQAREAGLMTLNGLYMLVSQAVAAQKIWNGMQFSQSKVDQIFHAISSDIQK